LRTLSVARERPVAPIALGVLTIVDRVARELGLDYFVTVQWRET
jgi:hypothetical protein